MIRARWLTCLWVAAALPAAGESPIGAPLGLELSKQGAHADAAIEFRRLALGSPDAAERGSAFWMAAHEYWRAGQGERAEAMLDRAENASGALRAEALLLRGETAAARRRWGEGAFFFDSVAAGSGGDATAYARRRLAEMRLRDGAPAEARAALADAPNAAPAALAALDRYERGRDKSRRVGGLLGMVPGLGYAYSGEYANALRSLILNGVFGFGMWHTAREEQWGAFGVITFCEFTWYSGSIYGGIDAAHRYNRERLEEAAEAIRGGADFEPDVAAWPLLRLKFTF